MKRFERFVLSIIEGLGVVGTITTMSSEGKRYVITWCDSHGSLTLWYILATIVLGSVIHYLKRSIVHIRQKLITVKPFSDKLTFYLFKFNGDLQIGQAVGIWHKIRVDKKFLFIKYKRMYRPGTPFAVATIDTFDDGNSHRMTLKHVAYCGVVPDDGTEIKQESYSEYYMQPYINNEGIEGIKQIAGGEGNA